MATKGFLLGDNSLRTSRPVRYVATKQTVKSTKRKKKKKPEWDIRRHELHKSKNAAKVPFQRWQNQAAEDSIDLTPDTVERRKLAIVQEVLYGHDKLQDVLSESDQAMSVVKDLFGDDPKTFMGFPNITAAPSLPGKENRYVIGPVAEPPQTPTHLSLLSDSIMRTPALNELSDDDKEDQSPGTPTDHATKHISSSFQPMLDLQRFQQFVTQERRRDVENQSPSDLTNERGSCVQAQQQEPVANHLAPYERGTEHLALYGGGHVEQHGSGLDHVAKHGIVCEGPTKPLGNSEPYFHLQAAVPLPTDAKATSVVRPNPEGRIEHVASGGGMALEADHLSEPSSFLSQKSTEIVAGGPGFLVPVTTGETTVNSSVAPNTRPSFRNVTADQQGSNKTKKAKAAVKATSNSSSSGLRSLDDLKKMVEELETEIAAYESETGRQRTQASGTVSESFSGYTASLITAVTKLMSYLKESEIQRKAELIMREQILQGFEEQRALVDALTNDILHTQEQNIALQRELHEYKKNTDEQLQYLKKELFAVLRSYEYNVLSSSINSLYSLNPVALKNQAIDELKGNHHDLEYLPGGPARQAHQQAEHGRSASGQESDSITARSFIPLATSSGQGIPSHFAMQTTHVQDFQTNTAPTYSYGDKTGGSLNHIAHFSSQPTIPTQPQSTQAHTPVGYSHPGAVPIDNHNGIRRFGGSKPQLSNHGNNLVTNPHVQSERFENFVNGQIGSNILMYPPTQGPHTQREDNVTTQVSKAGISVNMSNITPMETQPASSTIGYPASTTSLAPRSTNTATSRSGAFSQPTSSASIREQQSMISSGKSQTTSVAPPAVNELSSQRGAYQLPMQVEGKPTSRDGNTIQPITSTTPSLTNPQHHLQGQFAPNGHFQGRELPDRPILELMKPTTSISQEFQKRSQGVPTRMSWTTPSEAASTSTSVLGTNRKGGPFVTQQRSSNALPQNQKPLQQARPQSLTKPAGPMSNSGGSVSVPNSKANSLPPGHHLRERLQNLANRQRNLAAVTAVNPNVDSVPALPQTKGENKGVQQSRPASLHVHFKDPPVAGKEEPERSPPVSPIPYRNTTVTSSSTAPDKRVVVNLPTAWSDVSSTMSF
ncbi:uncharacterized protein [Montipora foliosa]|uniref:uncharacterized protein isoform X2 n=1 Tax=Montipora foliosa TaxID=591990 RepID=UPI0035F10ABB